MIKPIYLPIFNEDVIDLVLVAGSGRGPARLDGEVDGTVQRKHRSGQMEFVVQLDRQRVFGHRVLKRPVAVDVKVKGILALLGYALVNHVVGDLVVTGAHAVGAVVPARDGNIDGVLVGEEIRSSVVVDHAIGVDLFVISLLQMHKTGKGRISYSLQLYSETSLYRAPPRPIECTFYIRHLVVSGLENNKIHKT